MKKSLLVILGVLILGGCSNKDDTSYQTTTTSKTVYSDYSWLPVADDEFGVERLMYDRYNQKIVAYTADSPALIERNEEPNYFQYGFNDLDSQVYTTGHSADKEHNYKIIKMNEKDTETLYEMKPNEGIFPLAYKDYENMYFIKCTYDDNNEEVYADRVICKFNATTKKLEVIDATKGLMTSYGVVIDDLLYFTVYNDIDIENYTFILNKMDLESSKIEQVDDKLAEGEVYNNNGKLFVSDQVNLYEYKNNKNKYTKKSLNYFYDGLLYQVAPNDEMRIQLSCIDENLSEVAMGSGNLIDFEVKDGDVYAYTTSGVTHGSSSK